MPSDIKELYKMLTPEINKLISSQLKLDYLEKENVVNSVGKTYSSLTMMFNTVKIPKYERIQSLFNIFDDCFTFT